MLLQYGEARAYVHGIFPLFGAGKYDFRFVIRLM